MGQMKSSRRASAGRLLVVMAVAVAMVGLRPEAARADHMPVENQFSAPGPWGVVWDENFDNVDDGGCDTTTSPGTAYTLVYPAGAGFAGPHPVVVWGNGTSEGIFEVPYPTCYYEDFLRLLASWGFIVIAANTGQAGNGDHMRFGAAAMVAANGDPASFWYQKVDTDSISVAGHSQGALGAINAVLASPAGAFDSVLAMSIGNRSIFSAYNDVCSGVPGCIPVPIPGAGAQNDLNTPIFFARGTGLDNDPPCETDDWLSDETAADWYPTDASDSFVAGTVDVDTTLCGVLEPYPHLDLTNAFGYMNAWLLYTMTCSASAEDAFVGSPPEIVANGDGGATDHWQDVELQNMTCETL